jgi:hypothetical protein
MLSIANAASVVVRRVIAASRISIGCRRFVVGLEFCRLFANRKSGCQSGKWPIRILLYSSVEFTEVGFVRTCGVEENSRPAIAIPDSISDSSYCSA